MSNVVERIKTFNSDRDPQLVQLKYQEIQTDSFAFYRGTCHLFYEDWPADTPLNEAPPTWICGDLHLENFGSYKGDNRLVYFNINDFDEGALAPAVWELARMVTSICSGLGSLGIRKKESRRMAGLFLHKYSETLAKGKSR